MSLLYQVQCKASIPFKEVFEENHVIASESCNHDLAVATNNKLSLVEDHGSICSSPITLDCKVDTFCWSSDGLFLAVSDSAGFVHILSRKELQVIYSQQILEFKDIVDLDSASAQRHLVCITFIKISTGKDLYNLAMTSSDGKVYVIEQLNVTSLTKGIPLSTSSKTGKSLKLKFFNTSTLHSDKISSLLCYSSMSQTRYLTTGYGDYVIAAWEKEHPVYGFLTNTEVPYSSLSAVRRDFIQCLTQNYDFHGFETMQQIYSSVFTLCNKGHFYMFDISHLVLLKWWPVNFQDFIVKTPCNLASPDGVKLCKIFGLSRNPNCSTVSIHNLQNMEEIFSTPCERNSTFVSSPRVADGIYIIDRSSDSNKEEPTDLCIKKISKATADGRLLSLLQQHEFAEAIEFATKHKLDLQFVYQQEASYLLQALSMTSDANLAQSTFEKFKLSAAKITDRIFVGDLCLRVSLSDLNMTFQLLTLARDHLDSSGRRFRASVGDETAGDMELCLEMDRLLDLLVTYRMAFKERDMVTWNHFRNNKLPSQVAALLHNGNLPAATVVCSRHENELISYLEEDGDTRFRNLLKVVSQDADTDELVIWLEHIIPAILYSAIPQSVEVLTAWLHERATSLEELNPQKWPENGLKLANVFFKVQSKLSNVGFIREQLSSTYLVMKSKKKEVSKLRLLVSRLQLLIRLQSRYKCNIPLGVFIQETTLTLTFRMLDEVKAPELIPKCLETTVRPYMREHHLDEDDTLLQYVKEELAKGHKQAKRAFQSIRERKIVAIVKCLQKKKAVVEATTELAKVASIPWSQDVDILVRTAIDVTQAEISDASILSVDDECKEMYNRWRNDLLHCVHLERVPVITAKYDLGEILIRDDASLKRFVRLLIKHDSEEGLTDAVQLARTFSGAPQEFVYVHRVKHLISCQRVSECVEVLEKLPDIAVQLVNHTIVGAKAVLQWTHPMWSAERTNYCQASINMIEHMLRRGRLLTPCLRYEWADDLSVLKSILLLQTRYGETVSISDYNDKKQREALLARSIKQHYKQKEAAAVCASALLPSNVAEMSDSSNVGNTTVIEQSKRATDNGSSGDARPVVQGRETFAAVLGLARLLKVPLNTMQSQIALQAARKCQVKAALDICKDLYYTSPNKATASVLRSIALVFLSFLKTHPGRIFSFISDICEIVRFAATCCHDNKLLDVVALFNLCTLTLDVHSATDVKTKDILSQCMVSGPRTRRSDRIDWANAWYEESDGLTLDSTDVFPLVAQLAECLFNEQGTSLSCTSATGTFSRKLAALGDLVVQMTSKLKNARHCTMALQWVLKMQCIIVAYLSNHKAFYGESKETKMVVEVLMNIVKQANIEMKGYMEVLVEKILLSRKPDVSMAVGLLLGLPPKLAFQLLDNCCESAGNHFLKITASSRTGLMISRLHGILAQIPRYEQLLLDAKWAKDLNERKIPVDGLVFSPPQWKKNYLLKLICYPNISASILYNYCRDYHLDCDSALLQYVAVLLGGDVPSLDDGTSCNSPGSCIVAQTLSSALRPINHSPLTVLGRKEKSNSVKEEKRKWENVKEELKWVAQHIEEKYELKRQLERCLRNTMCPYDYDRAEFMLHLIESCSSVAEGIIDVGKGLKLIGYLRHVPRQRPPSEYETRRLWRDDAADNFSSTNLPALAKTRLPLHPLLYGDASHAWKIISNEVTERTAEFMAPIAKLLRLSEDKLYMTAADNVISSYMTNGKDKIPLTSWQLTRIQKLTEKITSRSMAVAMAKRISEILPSGEEKVAAYKWCISLVARWQEVLPKDSPDVDVIPNVMQKFEWNSRYAATEVVLSKCGLNSPENIKLMNRPNNLILHLYKHPSVVQRFCEPGHSYPDIHSLVDHVTEIHQLDGPKIRLALIQNLLLAADKQKETPTTEDDSTVDIERMRSAALVEDSSTKTDEEDLIQLLYLLSYDNPISQAKHLLKLFGNSKNRRITNSCRVRALHCLFHIIDDDETLFNLTNKTADDLRSDLRVLIYLTELEGADFKIPVSHLRQSDKSSVARSVIASSTRRHNPLALRVAAEMCREFGSVPPDTWVVLLQQLVALQQVSYLQQLLPDICRIPDVRTLPCLASVWQSCVTLPLVTLTSPLNDKQKDVALSSYRFLLRCPVLLRINLSSVAQHFIALELLVLALGCLLVSPSEEMNAKNLAKSMCHEIRNQLPDVHNEDQPLLGHDLIVGFLKDFE